MRVALTGASGFLGWHTRARLKALTDCDVVALSRAEWHRLPEVVGKVDAVIHVAGVNRGAADVVREGNVGLAKDLATAIEHSASAPTVIYANTIQAGNGTPYGCGKAEAGAILRKAAVSSGSGFSDVLLPNLFGEHGRPDYNSFVATFVDGIVRGSQLQIEDRDVELLHVQDAAQALITALSCTGAEQVRPRGTKTSVLEVYQTLMSLYGVYRHGEVPSLATKFEADLLNTLRVPAFDSGGAIPLERKTDDRGSLVEVVRAHGGEGQTFLSTTKPGITRGQHFHL
ncbi:NAD-dependent epimerase/dehydratase family protein, partial [Georgenia sp. 10Sc9-8]|nr:NAD-dependent epimerase/dehydratase family protein [Georgenia halotolerans]